MLDLFIGVLAFYLFGYGIAYGETHDVGFADTGLSPCLQKASHRLAPLQSEATIWPIGFAASLMLQQLRQSTAGPEAQLQGRYKSSED